MSLVNQSKYYVNYGLYHIDLTGDVAFQNTVKDVAYDVLPMFKMLDVPISYQPCTITFSGSTADVDGVNKRIVNVNIAKDDYTPGPIILSRYINSDTTSNKYGLIEMDLQMTSLFNFSGPGINELQYTVTAFFRVSLMKTFGDQANPKTYKYSINEIKQSNSCQLSHCLNQDNVDITPPYTLHIDAMNYRIEENDDKLYIKLTYPKNADFMVEFNEYSHTYNILSARANVTYNADLQYHFYSMSNPDDPVMELATTGYTLRIDHVLCNGTIKYVDYRRGI